MKIKKSYRSTSTQQPFGPLLILRMRSGLSMIKQSLLGLVHQQSSMRRKTFLVFFACDKKNKFGLNVSLVFVWPFQTLGGQNTSLYCSAFFI